MYKYYNFITLIAFSAVSLMNINNAKGSGLLGTPHFIIPDKTIDGVDYMSKTIIIKIKPEYRSLCSSNDVNYSALKSLMQEMGVLSFGKIYPHEQQPLRPFNAAGQAMVDLTLMYQFTYTTNLPLQQALNMMADLGIFEYAEPHVIPKLFYTVNDPSVGSQYHITKIQADQAWNLSKGDTNVVIGITDTGTQLDHPDLVNNIKHNYKDPIDNIDNDNDGYIDNFNGWDVGANDNDPTWQGDAHGVHVCGIASASTDNNIGVAGVGFKCKFMPVKIADATGALVASYTGIQYAAAHGCKVINCSWGGTIGGQYGQDIINFATFNMDALVVAAAGNSGDETLEFPGYYPNVMGVSATTSTDARAGFSSFNYLVSICAPGNNIYSTYTNSSYSTLSGTSMASPCAAGAAAIVRSYFPAYTALQTSARLRVTADNIFPPNSSTYKNKLGSGRVNLFNALNNPASPSIIMTARTISDGNDDALVALDTLQIVGDFTNFLAPTTNLTATISVLTASSYVSLIPGTTVANLGAIGTLSVANNNTTPFKVKIAGNAPLNINVMFKITYTDGAYTSSETFDVVVNVDYLNVTENEIASSVTSRGSHGWNNSPPTQGLGFKYKNVNLMYDGGLMIGVPDSAVSDVIRGMAGISSKDFNSTVNIKRITTGALSDFDTEGYMKDGGATQPLNILVHHKSFAWSTPGERKYIMYKYLIHNNGTSALNNLYAGICADWDIQGKGGDSNKVSFDANNKMAYTYYTPANGLYGGIKLLSNTAAVNAYAFDNIDPTTGINPNAGFSNLEKYTALSTMRTDAGNVKSPGNDVMSLVSTGPFTINPGDSVEVAFALLGGDDLNDLQISAINAQAKYDNMLFTAAPSKAKDVFSLQTYPNPASGITVIDINLPQASHLDLKLYNMIGQDVATISSGEYTSGKHQFNLDVTKFKNGIYYYQLNAGENKLVRKLVVSK